MTAGPELVEQIQSAISAAIAHDTAPELRNEANTFLQSIKDASLETWQACWTLFLQRGAADPLARMFGLQVVELAVPSVSPEAQAYIESTFLEYYRAEFTGGGGAEGDLVYLKNVIAHFVALLCFHRYPHASPEFFSPFLASTKESNAKTTDFVLRVLHELAVEISDAQLRLNKSADRLAKDSALRDAVRDADAPRLTSFMWEVLSSAVDAVGAAQRPTPSHDLADMALRVIADYVSWIDINLMVSQPTVNLLLTAYTLPARGETVAVKSAAADTLVETVLKGMSAPDKMVLLNMFNLGAVISAERTAVLAAEQARAVSDDESIVLRARAAKLLNATGLELCKVIEAGADADAAAHAWTLLNASLPLLLQFLQDPATADVCSGVFGFASGVLSAYKKTLRKAQAALSADQLAFLSELLELAFLKMRYPDDADWTFAAEGEEMDEDEAIHVKLRASLRVITDAIAALSADIYARGVFGAVDSTLALLEQGSAVAWQDTELALYLLYGFSQASQCGTSVERFTTAKLGKKDAFAHEHSDAALTPLGAALRRTCQDQSLLVTHPAVALQYFENLIRYHEFFKLYPELIAGALPGFFAVDTRAAGRAVQLRTFYLLNRFIMQTKAVVNATSGTPLSASAISSVLCQLQPLLLPIDVTLPEIPDAPALTDEVLAKNANFQSDFISQLYLFEAAGVLLSLLPEKPQRENLHDILDELGPALDAECVPAASGSLVAPTRDEYILIFLMHHLILAIANVAKGFPASAATDEHTPYIDLFSVMTTKILDVTKGLARFRVVRDAARSALKCILATPAPVFLPLIPGFVECFLGAVTCDEMPELFSFLGFVGAKYRAGCAGMLDALLLPVCERVIFFLRTVEVTGTDDRVMRTHLVRAYFQFFMTLSANGLESILYSERNRARLEELVQSVVHYAQIEPSERRLGFMLLNKLVNLWVASSAEGAASVPAKTANGNNATLLPLEASPLPGFEQLAYVILKNYFDMVLQSDFDLDDAQNYAVIGEVALLLKLLYIRRGNEELQYLSSTLFPALQCPAAMSEAFIVELQKESDLKQFKKFLLEWLKSGR